MRKCVALAMSVVVVLGLGAGVASAQAGGDCIDAAGTGFRVCDEFRAYWEGGGAELFGNPVSDEFDELRFDTGASYTVQYFERQRLELHPGNAGTPYGVQLGRLGAEVLAQQGRDWTAGSREDPGAPNYQAATGFAIAPEFTDFWSSHGLDFGDDGVSFRESLALFGYPISTARLETDAGGDPVLTQWFERARFEHRDGAVMLAALGSAALAVPGVGDAVTASMLAQVQRAVAPNADLAVAEATGWGLVDGLDHCFSNPGVGDMGVHYINTDLMDTTLAPLAPEAMVYQHDGNGELKLGAVEWIVPAEAWDAEGHDTMPELLGQTFHLNAELGVYILHAWLFTENPAGVFEDWNPNVSCVSSGDDDLDALRDAVVPYQDLDVAVAAGYGLVDGLDHCFDNPGVGAMGVHYINAGLLDTALDPLQPEAMVYQHGADGELSLGAVEWVVPAEPWDAENAGELPSVMGHELHLNAELGVYVLHAWIFLDNPAGVFEDWNPAVSCPS